MLGMVAPDQTLRCTFCVGFGVPVGDHKVSSPMGQGALGVELQDFGVESWSCYCNLMNC